MGVNDVQIKSGSNIDNLSKNIKNIANHCKSFGVKQIIISGLTLTTPLMLVLFTSLTIQVDYFVKGMVIVLLITATHHLRIYGTTCFI